MLQIFVPERSEHPRKSLEILERGIFGFGLMDQRLDGNRRKVGHNLGQLRSHLGRIRQISDDEAHIRANIEMVSV